MGKVEALEGVLRELTKVQATIRQARKEGEVVDTRDILLGRTLDADRDAEPHHDEAPSVEQHHGGGEVASEERFSFHGSYGDGSEMEEISE
jgi:hypothetical protein